MGKKTKAINKDNSVKLRLIHKPHHEGQDNPYTFAVVEGKGEEEKTNKLLDKFKPHEWNIFSKKPLQKDLIPILELNEGVSMLQYDENGIPIDGYDYYKYVATSEQQEGIFLENQNPSNEIKPDIDFNFVDQIDQDQKQVWDALYNPAFITKKEEAEEDVIIEGELEDDFIKLANEGVEPVVGESLDKKIVKIIDESQIDKPGKQQVQVKERTKKREIDEYFEQIWKNEYENSGEEEEDEQEEEKSKGEEDEDYEDCEEEKEEQEEDEDQDEESKIPKFIEYNGKTFVRYESSESNLQKKDKFIDFYEVSEYQKKQLEAAQESPRGLSEEEVQEKSEEEK